MDLCLGHAILKEEVKEGQTTSFKIPRVANKGADYDACTPNNDLKGQCFFYVTDSPKFIQNSRTMMQAKFSSYFNVNLKRIYPDEKRATVQDLIQEVLQLELANMQTGLQAERLGFEYNDLAKVFSPFTSYKTHDAAKSPYLYPNGVFRIDYDMKFSTGNC